MALKDYISLPRTFFARDTHAVAKDLLGKLLVRTLDHDIIIGRIVEVEAYVGENDLACHASKGKTPRTETMYSTAGHAYIYLIYGMYHCLNVVTEKENFPAAVLIRAIEPVKGVETMIKNRSLITSPFQRKGAQKAGEVHYSLTNGPGKLCQALHINRTFNAHDLTDRSSLFIADDGLVIAQEAIATSPRIGVAYAKHCADYPWRYYLRNSLFISKPQTHPP